ncbi:MAG: hypothetical protein ACFB9M_18300 [Myxococcota bacterium]
MTCRGLTSVLRCSPLAQDIDPKAFFMMLTTHYPALAHQDGLDLTPVYQALLTSADESRLLPLFLAFEEKGNRLGVRLKLPPRVASLSEDERHRLLELFRKESRASSDVSADVNSDTETKRKVIQHVMSGLRSSPSGSYMEASQLEYWLHEHIGQIFDGKFLNPQHLVTLLRDQSFSDEEIFVSISFAQHKLKALDVILLEPELSVASEHREQLIQRAKEAIRPKVRTPSGVAEPSKEDLDHQARLEDLGLGIEQRNPGRRQVVRIGALLTFGGLAGALAYIFRPNRPMDPAAFAETVPLSEAALYEGAFIGVLDLGAWRKIPPSEREARVRAFGEALRGRSLLPNLQVRTPEGELVIVSASGQVRMSLKYLRAP